MVNKKQTSKIPDSNVSSKGETSTIKIVLYMLVSLLIFLAGAFSFWFFQEKLIKKEKPSSTPSPQPSVTLAPTPEPTSEPEEVPTPTPSPTKSDLELIKEALASKHGKDPEETIVNISKKADPYAQGGVRFEGEIGGGMWLAYKQGDDWIIVFDGHGTIPCSSVDPYGFPPDMVPECIDEHGNPVTR